MTISPTMNHSLTRLVWGILITCVLLALPAHAQDPIVTAADPPSAEQETYDLDVEITGDNFAKGAAVDFFVTGTTNPGGIHVKQVKVLGPKKLKATIDVDAGATVDDFDIQVMSRGRTGKGIELFRVIEKVNPSQDSIPPNPVYDLEIVGEPELTPEGDYRVQIDWPAPADPPLMGAVTEYLVKARPESSFTLEDWEEGSLPALYRGPGGPGYPPMPGGPGSPESAAPRFLAPNTIYTVALRSADANENWSGLSNTVTFQTGPEPLSDWLAEEIDDCPPGSDHGSIPNLDLAYEADGSPAVFYEKRCDPAGPPAYVALSTPSGWDRVAADLPLGESPAFEIDPTTDEPVILASPLAIQTDISLHRWTGTAWESEVIDSGKFPYGDRALAAYSGPSTRLLATAYRAAPKGRRSSVRLALWNGQAWERHDITSSYNRGNAVVAFDDLGRAAVAFEDDADNDDWPDTLRFALWNGSSWESETIDAPQDPAHPICGWGASLQWNAAGGEFWASHYCVNLGPGYSSRVRICGQTSPAGSWQCSDLPEDAQLGGPALAFDQQGIAYVGVATDEYMTSGYGEQMLRLWSRDTLDPSSAWSAEIVDWSTETPIGLRVDPASGEPVIFHYAPLRPIPSARLLRKQLP
jgi:hypothetical protein